MNKKSFEIRVPPLTSHNPAHTQTRASRPLAARGSVEGTLTPPPIAFGDCRSRDVTRERDDREMCDDWEEGHLTVVANHTSDHVPIVRDDVVRLDSGQTSPPVCRVGGDEASPDLDV